MKKLIVKSLLVAILTNVGFLQTIYAADTACEMEMSDVAYEFSKLFKPPYEVYISLIQDGTLKYHPEIKDKVIPANIYYFNVEAEMSFMFTLKIQVENSVNCRVIAIEQIALK